MDVPDTRYPDDRSDSGLSSLRSGSGDERCGSRSSALSSTDDVANTHLVLGRSNRSPFNRSPLFVLGQQDYNAASSSRSPLNQQHNRATAPVWRDPSLAEPPQVRHVDSVQHQSLLLMSSHQGAPTSSGPPATSSVPTASLYPPPSMISPHPRPLHSHLAPNMYAPAHHIPDMLWKAPYNLPSSHLLAAAASQQQQQQNAHHGEEMMEREQQRLMQERHNERIASSIRERQIEAREIEKLKEREKERAEREKQEKMEREREEKERQEQALHNHFEKSLRQAAQQKREQWNPITGRPSQPQRSSSAEEDKKRAEQEMRDQRQHLSSRQDPNKDNRFYANLETMFQVQQRVPSMTGKVDYPPPAHSSRVPAMKQQQDKMTNMQHGVGQKNDLTMFSYSPYHPQNAFGFSHDAKGKDLHKTSGNVGLLAKSASPIDRDNLPNPPPLISEMKNSVIVKHDGKNPHHMEPRVSIAHSPSPKLMSHYMPLPPQTSKGNMYEYRSPTQSPHHHLAHTSPHHMEAQTMAAKTTHHRQISSPHHHRQSPHAPQHSSPEMRYRSTPEAQTIIYPTPGKANYQFLATTAGYSHHTTNVSNSKPKVSSPAPHHIYGKPTAGILSGLPPNPRGGEQGAAALQIMSSKPPMPLSISPSPFQQASQYHPPPPQVSTQLNCPPPAHRTVPYDRIYPGTTIPSGLPPKPSIHGTSPPTASAAPSGIPRTHPQYMPNVTLPSGMPGSPSMQMQPLDLGMSSSSKQHHHDNNVPSPKRKGTPVHMDRSDSPSVDAKKRKLEPPPVSSPQVLYSMVGGQPLLARVDEPTPLIASEATAITAVANAFETTAPSPRNVATPPNPVALTENLPDLSVTPVEVSARPGSADSGLQSAQQATNNEVSPVVAAAAAQPAASYCATATGKESPTASMKTAITPNSIDSEKSNSPGPTKSSGSYPVRHLKKAWLQRHTGEDMEDTTGIVGSGSCVTLPINISTSNNNKDPPVNTLHAIGSMAVNSISKPKHLTNKSNNRKGVMKEGTLNGHPSDLTKGDDSSSSDQERGRKSPPKRKPPKVKRKKGGGAHKKPVEEKKRKASTPTVASESGSDSDKDTASEKDSDSGASTTISVKKGNNSKEPRKRGRRPKISKGGKSSDEPRSKKAKEDVLPQRDPFRKPPVTQLKKTGESFLQDGPCFEVAPKLAKCRECRWTPNQRSKNMPNIFCRFYAFRRLRYTKNGQLAIAGFSDPHKNSLEDDIKLWLPNPENPPSDLDLETSKFLLKQVGDHFCDLLVQEKNAVNEHLSDDKTVAWKRVVQGVREMCDVCETTLFNFHWACGKCGFVVCLDCYKGRKNGTLKIWGETGKDRDEYSWLLCTNRQAHEQEKLMLTQIIADNCLLRLGKMVHEVRELWNIEQYCDCPMSKEVKSNNLKSKDIIKNIMSENMNGSSKQSTEDVKPAVKTEENEEGEEDNNPSPLSWFSDMLKKEEPPEKTVKKEKPEEGVKEKNEDASSEDDDNNFSTLRELLIRPSHKQNGSRAGSPTVAQAKTAAKRTSLKLDNLDEVLTSVIEESSPKEDEVAEEEDKCELKHFVRRRRYNWQVKGRVSLPIRIMTMTESKILYPNVPHSWLCDGKLLRLIDPTHKENYKIFQDQWKRGQPVIVSDVDRLLNKDLWNPDSFARDFGEDKNDLINCMTGNLVPNQPMKKFWEGFDHFEKRLKDDRGNPMLLKLKDWPPGEDFAEMLPTRFQDLMEVLPLGEYTHRNGRLNLASRLPDCFVRPDLGPKMYNAYGSALHPSKGTTNLHLDISDAVNVMVYVGIPKDGDSDEHIKEAFRAIDEAGCDILTRRRVRDKGELPGALWHIYNAKDADKIRDLLNKVVMEKGGRLEPNHDPIHDQSCYLDGPLRERLYKEYGVEGYAIVQCLGDAVFIPAGAPHQVRNLHNCIKVAEDFVSPENVSHCFHLTQEFRDLSDTHSNHEDKLQIKNIIYHAVKDSLSTLNSILNQHVVKIESESSESNGVSGIEAQKKEVSVDEAGTDV